MYQYQVVFLFKMWLQVINFDTFSHEVGFALPLDCSGWLRHLDISSGLITVSVE